MKKKFPTWKCTVKHDKTKQFVDLEFSSPIDDDKLAEMKAKMIAMDKFKSNCMDNMRIEHIERIKDAALPDD